MSVALLLDRFFSDEVVLGTSHTHVASFALNDRIEIRLYNDPPMFLALFCVDGEPILKEEMINESVAGYIESALTQPHLKDFILDYAD
jgi:hypothetical protein